MDQLIKRPADLFLSLQSRLLRLLALSLVLFVSACATGASFDETASARAEIPAGKARVTFYRPSILGAAIQPDVLLNGQRVGRAVPRGFFQVITNPGPHTVSATTEAEKRLSFQLAPGEEKFVKLTMQIGLLVGRVQPSLVDRATALNELSGLSQAQ